MSTLRVRRLDANRDATFGHGAADYLTGSAAAAQRVKARLLVLLGEWFLDTSAGVPWFNPGPDGALSIMGGPRNLQFAEAQVKKCILETDGIKAITLFNMTFNSQTRKLTVSTTVTTDDGDIASISVTP